MPSDAESTSIRGTLYVLREAVLALPDGGRIGPISWTLLRGARVRVRCASEAQWEAFAGLLSGAVKPESGALEEVRVVKVQTDTHLRATLDMNRSLDDYLQRGSLPDPIRLEGRRRSLHVLVDLLGITPRMARHPLKFCNPSTVDKVWALRFLVSQADLLVARDLLRLDDPAVREAWQRRWDDVPGALVVGEVDPAEPLPGPVQGWVHVDEQGAVTCGSEPAAPVADESPEPA